MHLTEQKFCNLLQQLKKIAKKVEKGLFSNFLRKNKKKLKRS